MRHPICTHHGTRNKFQSTHPLGVRLLNAVISASKEAFQSTHPLGVRLLRPCSCYSHSKFQSTHPLGVRPSKSKLKLSSYSFNPRTHSGCDSSSALASSFARSFQSTHPLGVRQAFDTICSLSAEFQSTHPLGVRLNYRNFKNLVNMFQSTHPLGVRLSAQSWAFRCQVVSIHAPTRGATFVSEKIATFAAVSIHAPTRGATHINIKFLKLFKSFNPRTHSGCDCTWHLVGTLLLRFQSTHPLGVRQALDAVAQDGEQVSIHAPTRGATAYSVID